MLPHRCLLVDECLHSNLLVLCGKGGIENLPLQLEPLCERRLETRIHQSLKKERDQNVTYAANMGCDMWGEWAGERACLCHRGRRLRHLRDSVRGGDGVFKKVCISDDPRDETTRARLLRTDEISREHKLHRAALADRPRETLRAAETWHRAEFDLRLSEFGALGGEDEVACHR